MIKEIKKIMEDDSIVVFVICVCILVLLVYFELVYIEIKEVVLIEEVKAVILVFLGVVFEDDVVY